jgi:RNA polymerase sigma factor (sigma-70 family)
MKFLFIVLINLINYNFLYSLYLSSYQLKLIVNLIKNPSLNINQRNCINKILFYSYDKWAIKKAIEFKKFHHHKCKNIVLDDLIFASKLGLYKSIKKYNGKTTFIFFSYFYIKGELLKTLTDYFSINNIPKQIRRQNKSNYTNIELKKYKKRLNPILVSYSNYWQFDKYQNSDNINTNFDDFIKIWQLINDVDPFCKRIFYLKYDFEFNKIRSNKKISELLCCSEENIRINIKKIKKKLNIHVIK